MDKNNTLTLNEPALIDVGAAGKGLLVDGIAALLDDDYVIDASGDLLHHADASAVVGLEHPRWTQPK